MPKVTHLAPVGAQAIDLASKPLKELESFVADIGLLQPGNRNFELGVARAEDAQSDFGVVGGLGKLRNG